MPSLRALIFDVDGTLADTERDGHRPAFNAAFADAGLSWHWDAATYRELLAVAGGKERIRHYAARYDPERAAAPGFAATVAAVHAAKTRHYLDRVAAGRVSLRPGVATLLAAARRRGLRLAIATTTTPDNVDALLRAALAPEAPAWFAVIGAGDVVAAKKPAPDIYRWVLERLALGAADCLAVEDSESGLAAASTAGLRCLVTPNADTADQDFSAAWEVLDSLAGLTPEELIRRFAMPSRAPPWP